MTLSRRRFLTICASLPVAGGAYGQSQNWQGRAFGADISITIHGGRRDTAPLLDRARQLIREVEAEFSLFDPISSVSQLNRTGQLRPSPRFTALMNHAERIHHATEGLFDPTIQPQWRALADDETLPDHIPWDQLRHSPERIRLAKGQGLTFNGIAQGYATDLVSALFDREGLRDTLVNIGEYRGQGGPWRLAVEDPVHGQLATRTLRSGAIATSSPGALRLGHSSHIWHPNASPVWSTISVEAKTATTADGFSTALTLAQPNLLRRLPGTHGITRITAITREGELASFSQSI